MGFGDNDLPSDASSADGNLSVGRTIYFKVTNNGNVPLANIQLSDTQIAGSDAITGIVWTYNGLPLTVGADGYEYLNGTLLTLQPGEYILGQGQIAAAPAGVLEGDQASVTANPVRPDGTIDTTTQVGDNDKWYGETLMYFPPVVPSVPHLKPEKPTYPWYPAPVHPVTPTPAVPGKTQGKQLPDTGEANSYELMMLAGSLSILGALTLASLSFYERKRLMGLR